MTSDELVTGLKSIQKQLEADDYVYDTVEQVIQLLRAGQRMRNCIADDTGARTRLNAAEAWDEATAKGSE